MSALHQATAPAPNATAQDAPSEADRLGAAALAAPDADALQDVITLAGNVLAPPEMGALYRRLEAEGDADLVAQCRRFAPAWRALLLRPKPWRRERLHEFIRLYRSDGYRPRAGRTLLVCIAGMRGGMLMPNTGFLQNMPDDVADVLIIMRQGQSDYRCGFPGIGDSLLSIAAFIREKVIARGYDHVAVLGVSQGANAAPAMADFLDASLGVAFSGRYLRVGGVVPLAQAGTAWESLCHCRGRGGPGHDRPRRARLYSIYGAENRLDARWAQIFAQVEPRMELLPVADYADHSVFFYLKSKRAMAPFLRELCLAATEDRPLRWPVTA